MGITIADETLLKQTVLVGIARGYIRYIPDIITATDKVDWLLLDIFLSAKKFIEYDGRYYLHKQDIRAGIHRRVLKILGLRCAACETDISSRPNVHHLKLGWDHGMQEERTPWGFIYGFTVLCQPCHITVHSERISISHRELIEFCRAATDPESPLHLPSHYRINKTNRLRRQHIDGGINYYTLAPDLYALLCKSPQGDIIPDMVARQLQYS